MTRFLRNLARRLLGEIDAYEDDMLSGYLLERRTGRIV
jgi:hypothetical protein